MSHIIDFYKGIVPDNKGRMLIDIWKQTPEQLEYDHDYIQWIFPLKESSMFNPDAPILSEDDIAEFNSSDQLKVNLKKSFFMMINNYGFECFYHNEKCIIEKSSNFIEKSKVWLTPTNHNFLRITRMLKSLRILGNKECAFAFFKMLQFLAEENPEIISNDTYNFWEDAITI